MAEKDSKKKQLSKGKSEALDAAKTVVDAAKDVNKSTPNNDIQEASAVFKDLLDVYKVKTAVKGMQVMGKVMEQEMKDEDRSEQTSSAAPKTPVAGNNPPPLAQLLPHLDGDQKKAVINMLLESDDKDLIYELMAGRNPGGQRLINAMKTQPKQSNPQNEMESMTNTMMTMMKMAGLNKMVNSEEKNSELQNMLAMFAFFKEMMGGNQNNQPNMQLEMIKTMGDIAKSVSESNHAVITAINNNQNNTLMAIKEALGNKPDNSGNQLEIFNKFAEQQTKLAETQMTNLVNQMANKEQFWEAQYNMQHELIESLKNMAQHRPTGDNQAITAVLQQIKTLQDQGLVKQAEDKEVQLKKIETDAEIAKLDKTLNAKTNQIAAQAQNIGNIVTLVSSILDGNKAANKSSTNPEKPSKQVSKMAGIPTSAIPAGAVR